MSAPRPATPTPVPGKAQVHSMALGRYDGPRRPQRQRYRVIAHHVLTGAWRSRFALRGPLMGAFATLLIASSVMIVFGNLETRFRGLAESGLLRKDIAVYMSFEYFAMWGQLLAVTVGCTAIADDLTRGAFQFYFSRPLRPGDYLRGKLLGVGVIIGLPMLLGPIILALVRISLAEDGETLSLLPILGKSILAGLYGTASIVMPSVALGALFKSRIPAQGAYVIYYLVLANMAEVAALKLGVPALAALSPRADLAAVTAALFEQPTRAVTFFRLQTEVPLPLAIAVLAALIGGGIAACVWRVRSIERAGVGGGA
jgi:hypothetical protein